MYEADAGPSRSPSHQFPFIPIQNPTTRYPRVQPIHSRHSQTTSLSSRPQPNRSRLRTESSTRMAGATNRPILWVLLLVFCVFSYLNLSPAASPISPKRPLATAIKAPLAGAGDIGPVEEETVFQQRIVAVGDVHGDFSHLTLSLEIKGEEIVLLTLVAFGAAAFSGAQG